MSCSLLYKVDQHSRAVFVVLVILPDSLIYYFCMQYALTTITVGEW